MENILKKIKSQAFFLVDKGSAEKAFELRYFTIDPPEKDNEVMIEVEGFGINYAEVMARMGLYKEAPKKPSILGYEVVGRIIQCGKNADTSLLGKRVLAFCRFGGYAKHVITYDYACVEVKENEPIEQLMALSTQGVTAYYMSMFLSPVRPTETVLIHSAAGGVGTMLIQMAKKQKARVIAKVGRKEKEQIVKDLGADYVVNYNSSDYIEEIKKILGHEKVDVVFNPVGGSTFKKDFSMLAAGGRLFLFGGAELSSGKYGIFSQLNFLRKMGIKLPIEMLMTSKSLLGVNMLHIADKKPKIIAYCLQKVYQMYTQEELQPQVGGIYGPEEFFDTHNQMGEGKTIGKLTIKW